MTPATLRSKSQEQPMPPQLQANECVCDVEAVVRTTDWEEMTRRLLIYAVYRTSRYGRSTSFYRSRIYDYVQEAVSLFLDQKRRYAPRPDLNLYQFFCSVVD